MDTIAFERSIWINAPRERVWQALTDPEQVAQWLVPNLPGAVMKRDADRFVVYLGDMGVEFMGVDTANAPRRLTIRSLPDRMIASTYSLDEQNGGTQVTVTMSGFESVPQEERGDRLRLSGTAWEQTLANLNAFIGGSVLPFPQALVSPLFGSWRVARQKLTVERSIWINAPRERVWRAISDPKEMQAWFSPTTPWELTADELGGRMFVRDAETNAELYTQVIEHLDPPNKRVTRSVPETPNTEGEVSTYILTEENGGTRLTLHYTVNDPESVTARWLEMEQHTMGFGMMLQNTKAHVEGTSLPFPFGF